MEPYEVPPLSADELSSATGEPIAHLQQLQSLGLIGSKDGERFAREDIERVRLIQFLERRQIPAERIARAEQEEEILRSVLEFLFPDGWARRIRRTARPDLFRQRSAASRAQLRVPRRR